MHIAVIGPGSVVNLAIIGIGVVDPFAIYKYELRRWRDIDRTRGRTRADRCALCFRGGCAPGPHRRSARWRSLARSAEELRLLLVHRLAVQDVLLPQRVAEDEGEEDEHEHGAGAQAPVQQPAEEPEDDRGHRQLDGAGEGVAHSVVQFTAVKQVHGPSPLTLVNVFAM